jgi:hypothetical protein
MTQKLVVKTKNKDGSENIKHVNVLRSWQDSDGAQVFLHSNGVYGYKGGEPVRSVAELSIISAVHHRRAAESWWERAGRKMADEHYTAIDEQLAAMAGDFAAASGTADSDLDMILYYRTAIKGEGASEVQGPFSWMEIFSNGRPDWWGQAKQINFDDWIYLRAEDAETPDPGADVWMDEAAPIPPEVFAGLEGSVAEIAEVTNIAHGKPEPEPAKTEAKDLKPKTTGKKKPPTDL